MLLPDFPHLLHTLVVGALAYAAVLIFLRAFGKRTLAKWSAFDFVVTIAFGSVLDTAVTSTDLSAARAALAFGLLILLQYLVTWISLRSPRLEGRIKGRPALLVRPGSLQTVLMKRERVSEADVRAALRARGIVSLSEVDALVLETTGDFSLVRSGAEGDGFAMRDVESAG